MPQYYGSTAPQSASNVPAQTYSNFNGVNTPVLKSSGTQTFEGTQSFSGTFTSTGAVNLNGTNSFYFVGSSSGSLGGTSQSTNMSFTVPTVGIQSLAPTGTTDKFYLLDAPSAGKKVALFNAVATTSQDVLVYADSATSLAVWFKNAGGGVFTSSNCLLTMYRGQYVELTGHSTKAWIITAVSTWGSTGLPSLSSST